MTFLRRAEHIAASATIEHARALAVKERAVSSAPELVHAAGWLVVHLAAIEEFFVESARQASETLQEVWLDTAERWLAFSVEELRRLERRLGIDHALAE